MCTGWSSPIVGQVRDSSILRIEEVTIQMIKEPADDTQEELDSYDLNKSLAVVAAVVGNGTLESYKDIQSREYNIDSLGAAKLLTNQIEELRGIISYTPAMIRPTREGEMLRVCLMESLQQLENFREALVYVYQQDDGYEDIGIPQVDNKEYDIS